MSLSRFKRTIIKLDKANNRIPQVMLGKEGDYYGRELEVHLLDDGERVDTTEVDLNFQWKNLKSGEFGVLPFEEEDVAKGKYVVAYPPEMLTKGDISCAVQIIEGGSITHTMNFNVSVEGNPLDSEVLMEDNSFKALGEALVKINSLKQQFDDAVGAITEDSEVILARDGFPTLGERLDSQKEDYANFKGLTTEEIKEIKLSIASLPYDDLRIDVFGLEVDFENKAFTRVAGAVGKSAGTDFDNINAFGGRRRCNLADDGTVLAYYGDAGYVEDGSNGQVMVEQPAFYYRVVPLKLDKVIGGKGYHLRKARYYVSDTKKVGFKLHPAFIRDGQIKDFIYLSAYEGCAYDASTEDYIKTDEQIVDFAADKLSSIANIKPMSGLSQALTRANTRKLANNRGTGWEQLTVQIASLTQLLFAIEYASFNTQNELGFGVLGKPPGEGNESELTGSTTQLGNKSGHVVNENNFEVPTYRGEENWWGNVWKWADGINFNGDNNELYIADHDFVDNIDTEPYKNAEITMAEGSGYVSAFAYNEEFDWLFFASELKGNSSVPVGDYNYNTTTGWRVARFGGWAASFSGGGGFCWYVDIASGGSDRAHGGRLVYVPDVA